MDDRYVAILVVFFIVPILSGLTLCLGWEKKTKTVKVENIKQVRRLVPVARSGSTIHIQIQNLFVINDKYYISARVYTNVMGFSESYKDRFYTYGFSESIVGDNVKLEYHVEDGRNLIDNLTVADDCTSKTPEDLESEEIELVSKESN